MKKIYKTYSLSCNNEVFYIGRTEQLLKNRLKRHVVDAFLKIDDKWKYTYRNANKVRKLTNNNIGIKISLLKEYPSLNEALEGEKELISSYIEKGVRLTNHTAGGDGSLGLKHSEETKKKISKNSLNWWKNNPEARKFSKEHKDNLSKAGKGRIFSKEHIENMKNAKHLSGKDNPKSKKVVQYSLAGTKLTTFDSIGEAARIAGLAAPNIIEASRNKRRTAGGFVWRLVGESFDYIPYKRPTKAVHQFDLDGNLIKEYTSIKKAGEQNGVFGTTISLVCKGKQKTAGGFMWKYASED